MDIYGKSLGMVCHLVYDYKKPVYLWLAAHLRAVAPSVTI